MVLSLFWLSERQEATRELVVVTRQNVSGLNLEAQVRYRGIRVGKVRGIVLDPMDSANILIRVAVAESVPLTRGTTARLSYQGITGIAHILLEDNGNDPQPLSGDLPQVAMQPSLVDQLEDALPVMLAQGRQFLENANAVLDQNNRQHLSDSLANLEATTERANTAMAQMQKLLSDENVAELSATIRQSGALMQEARQLVVQLQALSERVDHLVQDSNSEGDVSSVVPRFNRMTEDLSAASRQLKQTLQRLEESPRSLILGSPPGAPGPGEPGFTPSTGSGR